MKCPNCGREVPEGKRFCPSCGREMVSGVAGRVTAPVEGPSTATPTGNAGVSEAGLETSVSNGEKVTTAKGKGLALVALVLALLPLLSQLSIPYFGDLNVLTLFTTIAGVGGLVSSVGEQSGMLLMLMSLFYLAVWIVAIVLAVRALMRASKGTAAEPMAALVADATTFFVPVLLQMMLSTPYFSLVTATSLAWLGLVVSIVLAIYAGVQKSKGEQES